MSKRKTPTKRRMDTAQSTDQDTTAERPIIDVINDIRSGAMHPKSLSSDDRRRCVLLLQSEGMSVAEVARLLAVSERTIARDRAVIHEENAIEPDPRLRGRISGRLMMEVEAATTEMKRAARRPEARPADRIEAARSSVEVLCKAIERLQSMGVLPNASSHYHTHALGEGGIPSVDELREQTKSLYAAAKAADDEATCNELKCAYQDLKHISAAETIKRAAEGKEGGCDHD